MRRYGDPVTVNFAVNSTKFNSKYTYLYSSKILFFEEFEVLEFFSKLRT